MWRRSSSAINATPIRAAGKSFGEPLESGFAPINQLRFHNDCEFHCRIAYLCRIDEISGDKSPLDSWRISNTPWGTSTASKRKFNTTARPTQFLAPLRTNSAALRCVRIGRWRKKIVDFTQEQSANSHFFPSPFQRLSIDCVKHSEENLRSKAKTAELSVVKKLIK